MRLLQKRGELRGQSSLLAAHQLDKQVLLAGEVKEERAVCHACRRRYRLDVGTGHARAPELGEAGREHALPRLAPTRSRAQTA